MRKFIGKLLLFIYGREIYIQVYKAFILNNGGYNEIRYIASMLVLGYAPYLPPTK